MSAAGGRASLDRLPDWGSPRSHGDKYKDGVDEDIYQAAFDAVESLLYPIKQDPMSSSFPSAADRNGICDYRSLRRSPASKSTAAPSGRDLGGPYGTSSLRRPPPSPAPSPAAAAKAPSLPALGLDAGCDYGLQRPSPPSSLAVKSVVDGDPVLGRIRKDTVSSSSDVSPTSPVEPYSAAQVQRFHSSNGSLNSSTFLDDLRESELHLKRKRAFIERVIEQHDNLSEQKRRQDIFQLCEKLHGVEVSSSKPHHKSSRIKTNGSLPRDKSNADPSLTSPVKSCSSSEDIHSLGAAHGAVPANTRPVHGYENVPLPPMNGSAGADHTLRLLGISEVPPASPASPLSTPTSPRRGIKTVLAPKDSFSFPQDITNEVIEKHLGLPELYKPTQNHASKQGRSSGASASPLFGAAFSTSTPRDSPRESRPGPAAPWSAERGGGRAADRFILPLDEPRPQNGTGATAEKVVALSLELEFVHKERLKIMSALTVLKSRLSDIESQQEEAARDAAMEQAFIKAELQAKGDKARAHQVRIRSLRERADSCQREIDSWQQNRNKQQRIFHASLEHAEADLGRMRAELAKCESAEARADLKDRIYQQTDVVESEKKLYEDLEFKYLEEESVWLARKEELNKDLAEALNKYEECVGQVAQLESWLHVPNESNVAQSESFTEQKLAYLQRLEEGQTQLELLDARIDELVRQGAGTLGSNQNIPRDFNESDMMNASSVGDLDSTDASSELLCASPVPNSMESSYYSYQLDAAIGGEVGGEAVPVPALRPARGEHRDDDADLAPARRPENGLKAAKAQSAAVSAAATDSDPGATGSALSRSASQSTSTIGDLIGSGAVSNGPSGADGLGALGGTLPLYRRRRPEPDQRTLPRHQRPLTRYLPIRAADLDLRQHIESAGHAVDLCAHLVLDRHSCRGYLHKASTRFGNWQKRWFLFDRTNRTLAYYKNRREQRIRGGVHFQSIAEVYVDHAHGAKQAHPNCVFVVKTPQRSYQLMAPTPEAMRIWVDVIFTGAEAYQEFD